MEERARPEPAETLGRRLEHPEVAAGPRLAAAFVYLLELGRRRLEREAAEAQSGGLGDDAEGVGGEYE
jgi:hypothetical protein